ncbi:DUF5946 family protein [Mucilaginibacter auburnensis]|uniref:Uncharacterized protein n=1 Tax=Mucilaginibacter auburnensis TaxID=1457233 RepID=A0A2H9VN28_9SPHI|nr:DUF5946 family protein [Mucilaginibacter auburnensis]PJJ79726.1 hypothetical protein CLV57_2863 [Mucilaginibacter auburnensis]
MQNWQTYAEKHGIKLLDKGPCQFCGAPVLNGVAECHQNVHHIAEILDYNDPANYITRFLSVDAMALHHYEVHGPWNNYIHFARLVLIFENKVDWNYSLTPVLSDVVNDFKRTHKPITTPPTVGQRGSITTVDLLTANTPNPCQQIVKDWAYSVYKAFYNYKPAVEPIVAAFMLNR